MSIWSFLRVFVNKTYLPLYLLQGLKNEAHLLFVRWNNQLNPLQIVKRRDLANLDNLKLHFGCGEKIVPGWVNIDGYYKKGISYVMDLRCPLPFAANSASLIFTEHVIEHLDYEKDISLVLREFFRILKPSGVVRIIVPDLENYCKAYVNNDIGWFTAVLPEQSPGACVINHIFLTYFHKFIYDFATLANCLERAGFQHIVKTPYNGSQIDELNLDTLASTRESESLCVEARKSARKCNS